MRSYRRIAVAIGWIVVLFACSLAAQRGDRRPVRAEDDLVNFESFDRSMHADTAVVDILYRFRHDFFVFERQAGSPLFSGTGEVSIEILDSAGNSVSRHIQSTTMTAQDNAISSLRKKYYQGMATFQLPRGHYTALCEVTDKVSAHKQSDRRLPIMMPHSRVAASSLLLAKSFDSTTGVVACNLGGDAYFNSPLYVVVELSALSAPSSVTYSLTRSTFEQEEHRTVQGDTTVPLLVIPHVQLLPGLDSNTMIVYRFAPHEHSSVGILTLPGERLAQGRYEFHLRLDAKDTSTIRSRFALRWIDMPQSLHDLDFATMAMKYITTDEEYDKLSSGREASRIQAFEDFWKKRDPTPTTAYNEQLAEYFRRVDYAYTNFRTLRDENGITTDRGKIYILYGAPSATDRQLSPDNAPREVWRYTQLKKVFTFEDSSRQGNYKLIQTDTQ
jgi:GWxTD domain-containing protein